MPIRLLLLALLVFPLAASAQWKQVISNTKADIHDIRFVTKNTGYAAADNAILKSSDGGENWQELVTHKALVNLTDLCVTDDSIFGFGVNAGGIPYKLSLHKKGGQFSIVHIPQRVRSPQFMDGDIFYLDNRRLYNYHDGKPESLLSGVDDFKADSGRIVALSPTSVSTSEDRGITWSAVKLQLESLPDAPPQTFFGQVDSALVAVRYLTGSSNTRSSEAGQVQHLVPSHFYYYIAHDGKKAGKEVFHSLDSGESFTSSDFSKEIFGCHVFGREAAFLYGEKGVIFKLEIAPGIPRAYFYIEVIVGPGQQFMMRDVKIYNSQSEMVMLVTSNFSKIDITELEDGEYLAVIRYSTGEHRVHFIRDSSEFNEWKTGMVIKDDSWMEK